jgi:DNA polymerase elongation subunit (family B)
MKTLEFDIETYPNYTLFALRNIKNHKLYTFEIKGDDVLSKRDGRKLTKLLKNNTVVTFNGIGFDEPITAYALLGKTPMSIYRQVKSLIEGNTRSYEFYKKYPQIDSNLITTHIDLIDVARGQASLKLYGARLGTKKLQDLPYHVDTKLTKKQMKVVKKYCENDLILTEELYQHLHSDLELREAMGKEYNMNLMSFKGAKIAELILVKECNINVKKVPRPDSVRYDAPSYIEFKTPMLQKLFEQIKNHEYIVTEAGKVLMPDFLKEEIEFDGLQYKFGIGGLHASILSTAILPKDDEVIVDIDYKSLYPSIIIENDFSPKHIGSKFAGVYKMMYDKRNKELKPAMKKYEKGSPEYKDLDIKQNTMKLVLNSSFGQTGQRFSKIYDPNTLINTTLTGQLTLMMVIEKLHYKGFSIFYANTDGITLLAKKKHLKKIQKVTAKFDDVTGLEMEYNYFTASYIRDVNNFVNITDYGDVKAKGTFGEVSIEKNPQTPIVFKAIGKYLLDGTDFKTTIRECKDINEFCSSRSVTGGAVYATNIPELYPPDWQEKLNSKRGLTKKIIKEREKLEALWVKDNGEYLGKVVRWYYSKKGNTIHYKKSGNKVPMTDGAKPLMDLPENNKIPKDLDYEWYFDYTIKMLKTLGVDYVR